MRMTYGIAYSLGLDAANRQMQQAGRRAWNEEDAELAAATLNRHFPLCAEVPGIRPEICGCRLCRPRPEPSCTGSALGVSRVSKEGRLNEKRPLSETRS